MIHMRGEIVRRNTIEMILAGWRTVSSLHQTSVTDIILQSSETSRQQMNIY